MDTEAILTPTHWRSLKTKLDYFAQEKPIVDVDNCYFASFGVFRAFVQNSDKASVQTDKALGAMFCANRKKRLHMLRKLSLGKQLCPRQENITSYF